MHILQKEYGCNGVILLDGGMGQELRHRCESEPTPLWSAQALLDQPEIVRQIHEEYIRAGARVITTNTYAIARLRLAENGFDESAFEKLLRLACSLAVEARDNCGEKVLIAGSLPPLNGSYIPENVLAEEKLSTWYAEYIDIMAEYVDVFVCETMSTAMEGRVAATAASAAGKPVWVGWTLHDDGSAVLRSDETIDQAWQALAGLDIQCVFANCCAPESASVAIAELANLPAPLAGAYANGFTGIPRGWTVKNDGIDALSARRDLGPDEYAEYVANWVNDGAAIVGGCCEIGPAHIKRIHETLLTL